MKSARFILLAALVGHLAACDRPPQALGTATSIIVIASDTVWAAVGEQVQNALEPRIFTVRDERTFEVTHVAPSDPSWTDLRNFRQVVAIGAAEDAWVSPVVAAATAGTTELDGMRVARANNVWVRNQLALAVVLPSADATQGIEPALDRVGSVLDSLFRIYTVQRMYTSLPDSALSDTLSSTYGFRLLLPTVYSAVARSDRHIHYQNTTTVGGDLVRSVLVTWRDGAVQPSRDAAVAWRDSIASTYNPQQRTLSEQVNTSEVSSGGAQGIEIQGAWEGTDPAWPMGGLFISRMVACPAQDRTFLLDTWLYAPGPRRSKYEYMVQLQTILGTFECGGG